MVMDSISGYKNKAVASLSGLWGKAAVATLIYCGVQFLVSSIIGLVFPQSQDDPFSLNLYLCTFFTLVTTIALYPLTYGFLAMFLTMVREKTLDYNILFEGFKDDYKRITGTILLQKVYTFLWTLLFIIPGIVKYYEYCMASYVMKDYYGMRFEEAIEESMRLTKGHKWHLFKIHLSLIGWFILSLLSCGIGFIFLIPYVEAINAQFYIDIKQDFADRWVDED